MIAMENRDIHLREVIGDATQEELKALLLGLEGRMVGIGEQTVG